MHGSEGHLQLQRQLQVEHFNVNPPELRGAERARYVREMVQAAVDELHEALHQVVWKPWAQRGAGVVKDRDAYVDELVDVYHFLLNLLLVAGVTEDELDQRYRDKVHVNITRRVAGEYVG